MTSYAGQKGRAAPQVKAAPAAASKPVTPDQQAAIEANRDFILEHMPEILPVIRTLHAEGLISGWRNVTRCTLLENGHD